MVSEKDLNEFILGSFGLRLGEIIIGREIWNKLIQEEKYLNVKEFLGIQRSTMENSLIEPDKFLNDLFGLDMDKIPENLRKKIEGQYRISSCKVEADYYEVKIDKRKHLIKIYVNYRIAKGTKWSQGEWVLLTYRPDAPEKEMT